MPTSEIAHAPSPETPRFDTAFAKRFVAANAAVPLALLAWDTYRHQLGVNGVNFALHTTGLMGLILLLLSLAVKPLRRWTEWNEIIAVRRTLGLSAFGYLCVHLFIFIVFDRGGSLSSTFHEIVTRRYLQIGAIGWTLFVPLAVTSTNRMVRALGAKRWKRLHRLTYIATSLGAVHYYLSVKADVRQPLAFALVLALLLGVRPIQAFVDSRAKKRSRRRFWSGDLRVISVKDETPDVKTFRLGAALAPAAAGLPFTFRPGQYLNVALTVDGRRVNRSFTLASSPEQSPYCEITVKRAAGGLASRYLHEEIRAGSLLKITAPAGRFVFTGDEADAVFLVAGGVGITPLMSILRSLTDRSWKGAIHLLYAVRTRADVIFAGELEGLQRRFPNLHVVVTLSGVDEADASWTGARGRISGELLDRAAPPVDDFPTYICGPDGMMAAVRAQLLERGIAADRIFTEDFTPAVRTAVDASARPPASSIPDEDAGRLSTDASAAAVTVTFRKSKATANLVFDRSVLETAEDAGLDLPFECRSGICGQCKAKLLRGKVTMEVQDALSAADKAEGWILTCQAHATTDVIVDA